MKYKTDDYRAYRTVSSRSFGIIRNIVRTPTTDEISYRLWGAEKRRKTAGTNNYRYKVAAAYNRMERVDRPR